MAQSPSGKGDLRGAAERLELGIERYGEGDLAAALVEFEAALKLYPGSARGRQFASWVRDVQAGKRSATPPKPDGLDADALRAVNEALDDEPPSVKRAPAPQRSETEVPAAPERPGRSRRATPATPLETAATMQSVAAPPPERTRRLTPSGGQSDSPWDPVPLTPGGQHERASAERRQRDRIAELQSSPTKAVPLPPGVNAVGPAPPGPLMPGSSSTITGMPPLEPRLLTPPSKKRQPRPSAEDRPESVTREFHSATPTGPNLRPLDVPELTDEQIQGLLSLDSPLLPEGRTSPELDRIDGMDGLDPSREERLIELEAVPTPLPQPAPAGLKERLRKNDTNPMGLESLAGEFDPQQLTPTGVKPQGLKPVRAPRPEDDPYADLNLLPLEVAPDLGGPDEVEEGGTNPTNPFIRGAHAAKLAQYTSYGSGTEPKLEEMPPLPTLPGARTPSHPLRAAEAALQAGDAAAAVDACEVALAESGGLTGNVARDHLPLVEQIYGAVLLGADRVPVHGVATADLEPRSAFILSRLDGAMSVEDVLDVSGMPRLEALRVLALLVRRGAVVIK